MNSYTNARRWKSCPECQEKFLGDETVSGEICQACQYAMECCSQCEKDYPPSQMKDGVCLSCLDKEGT